MIHAALGPAGPGTGPESMCCTLLVLGQVLLVDAERFALELVEGLLDAVGDGLADLLLWKERAKQENE